VTRSNIANQQLPIIQQSPQKISLLQVTNLRSVQFAAIRAIRVIPFSAFAVFFRLRKRHIGRNAS
jgi:hypothetical protein